MQPIIGDRCSPVIIQLNTGWEFSRIVTENMDMDGKDLFRTDEKKFTQRVRERNPSEL